jgi:parvulin-like peptidyl-prolyl isomerase
MRFKCFVCVLLCLSVASVAGFSAAAGAAQSPVVIDRILAVVNGSVVTLSDVQAARRFALIPDGPWADVPAAVEQVIDRRLALVEVERYAPPEPPADRIDTALAQTRARFRSESEFTAALAETGLTIDQLRRHYRDNLRQQAYEQQRFGFAFHPSDDETLAFYRANPDRFKREGVLAPFDDVRDAARAALIANKRAELIRDWIAGLRRRANIVVLAVK